MIKVFIVAFTVTMALLGGGFFYQYMVLKGNLDDELTLDHSFLIVSLIVWATLLLFVLLVYFFWNDIKISAHIIKCTADYLAKVKKVILVPVILLVMEFSFIVWWSIAATQLYSTGEPFRDSDEPFSKVKKTNFVQFLWVCFEINMFWTSCFII
jgi:hypothetical protein